MTAVECGKANETDKNEPRTQSEFSGPQTIIHDNGLAVEKKVGQDYHPMLSCHMSGVRKIRYTHCLPLPHVGGVNLMGRGYSTFRTERTVRP